MRPSSVKNWSVLSTGVHVTRSKHSCFSPKSNEGHVSRSTGSESTSTIAKDSVFSIFSSLSFEKRASIATQENVNSLGAGRRSANTYIYNGWAQKVMLTDFDLAELFLSRMNRVCCFPKNSFVPKSRSVRGANGARKHDSDIGTVLPSPLQANC